MSTTSSATHPGGPPAAVQPEPTLSNPESFVREAFDDIAILIGGAASYHLEDDLLWTMMTRLDQMCIRDSSWRVSFPVSEGLRTSIGAN